MLVGVGVGALTAGLVAAALWPSRRGPVTAPAPAPTTAAPATTTTVPAPAWTAVEPSDPFAPDSFYNAALPTDAPLAADSRALVADFVAQIAGAYKTVNINTTSYSVPVYVVNASTPTVHVDVQGCNHNAPAAAAVADLAAVPIPAGATPAAGTDHDLVVWQPSSDQEWELWEAVDSAHGWVACSGGRFTRVSAASGVFPAPTGVTASGLSLLGGLIRLSDLRRGRIDHVLNVAIPQTLRYPAFVAPADRTDGYSSAGDAIPEGTRFRLDPHLDLATLHLPPIGLLIARALQTYGMVVTDTAGGVTFQAQDPSPLVAGGQFDPWALSFGNTPSYDILANVPWSDLEAVRPPG